jgi:phage/plasmid-like protein (TIGR03299 family)
MAIKPPTTIKRKYIMAHMIDSMAYTGQTPWHGLGVELTQGLSVDQWRIAAGLGWEVREAPVMFNVGSADQQSLVAADGSKVLFRSDNLFPLSVVSDSYRVVQPETIMDFYKDLSEQHGFQMETAGSLAQGRKIWALARVGDSFRIKGQDEVAPYVLMATSFDKTMATRVMFTTVRVVCNNTLQLSVNCDRSGISIPHSAVVDKQRIMLDLGIMQEDFNMMHGSIDLLSDIPVSRKQATAIIAKTLFDLDIDADSDKEISTRKANIIRGVTDLFDGRGIGSDLRSASGTAWGLVNAVTQFVDHSQGNTANTRINSAWFGTGANTKKKIWDNALALAA